MVFDANLGLNQTTGGRINIKTPATGIGFHIVKLSRYYDR